MFRPKTTRIENIAKDKQEVIKQLESIFINKTRVYIDYANVRPWSSKLGWHIDLKRLKQFLDSFDTIEAINFYNGYLAGNERSEKEKKEAEDCKYILRAKPVKIMNFSIDVEIGVDMLLDCERNSAETFVLWSGDSDFADPIEKLIIAGKKVFLFATARKVSKELSALGAKGLMIFDIQKIRDFICWKKEIERKRDPSKGAPKL